MAIRFGSRRVRNLCALGATTCLTQLALAAPAFAQTEAPAEAAAADPSSGLSEIVVTATRSAQSIQKVPISMLALGAETLAERQVKGLSDFAALLPSVSFEGIGPGRNTAFFRGIVPAGGAYASVGYYLDDIPITGTEVPDIHAYDLERVEALAGPQGTLYGAGSLAGTIRLITNKPKLDKFEFGYDVEANKYGKGDFGGQLESYINVPLSDTMAVRAWAIIGAMAAISTIYPITACSIMARRRSIRWATIIRRPSSISTIATSPRMIITRSRNLAAACNCCGSPSMAGDYPGNHGAKAGR